MSNPAGPRPTTDPHTGTGGTSEADRMEQQTPAAPEDERDPADEVTVLAAEADEADALEQLIAVPLDEDYPPTS